MSVAIRLSGVSKSFPVERRHASVLAAVGSAIKRGKQRVDALRAIDLEVQQGEKIGLVGRNGAGKTTLLKVISGLYLPDAGRVETHGDLTLMAGLGIGMIDDLTVRDNIRLYGAIYGVDRSSIDAATAEILAWAGLDDFAEARLQNLSTGMRTRIAFSTARYFESEVFLLDEAFSGADRDFRKQWRAFFDQYRTSSRTFLVATHDLEFLESFCSRTLWMDGGALKAIGPTQQVLEQYTRATSG